MKFIYFIFILVPKFLMIFQCQKNERKNSKVLPNLRSAIQGLDGTEKPKLVKRKDITNKI